ncbi:ArsR/SmtB family transcription factor [Sinanaerobacter chloroacetimidivorans]|jgi:ArsR family transcriptional regulator|uniref:Winged helix-turn-helix transcriptional regulator n=1 Tax=Sinanaerobacter chloroacetimidivorans TaxID=2818044 RepID=A0A8J8B3X0_9FIRM|nr:metalloregulator ArsR/SmtB family transcription factor [Sinanaerobacter chloroacetimidivorans]MBR0598750.1 winged helix-turn-helix transcriptional regulator [Sinanaerobacter chloroacetimidivorans]
MDEKYMMNAKLFKALSDPNRLSILDMLSCGELCACKILEEFSITQPTLSHHMKILCDVGLVKSRREGKWTHYTLDTEQVKEFQEFFDHITTKKEDCLCNSKK